MEIGLNLIVMLVYRACFEDANDLAFSYLQGLSLLQFSTIHEILYGQSLELDILKR